MLSNRTYVILSTVLALVLLSVFLYLAGVQFLHSELEDRLDASIPHTVEINRLDLGFYPFEVRLHGTTIRRDREAQPPLAILPKVVARPDLSSLLSGTWVLRNVTVNKPSVTLRASGDTATASFEDNEAGPQGDSDTDGIVLPIEIRRIRVRNGSLTYLDGSRDTGPILRLNPFRLTTGTVNTSALREGVELHVRSGIENSKGQLTFNGVTRVSGGVETTGELRADRLDLTLLQPFLDTGVTLAGGSLSGVVPFSTSDGGIRTDTSTVRVNGARVRLGEPPAVKPETAPIELDASAETTTSVDPPSDTSPAVPLEIGDVRLEVLDSTITFVNQSGIPPVELERATVLAGPVDGLGDSFPLRAQVVLGDPSGHIQLKGRVAPVLSSVGFEEFIGRLKVRDVGELNRFVRTVSPIQLKKGELDAAVRGLALDHKLDFTVQLYFKGLQSSSVTNPNSTVLGIPVNLFVKYLKQNDGNLNLPFAVRGTPRRPVLDTTGIRTRILLNLGVEAAVIGTLGVPVYLGNELIQRTSGVDLLGTARSSVGDLLGTNPSSLDPVFELEGIDSD